MAIQLPENIDLNNPEFQNAWALIQQTHRSVFLTGKAGTGKSTFLKYICATTKKKHVVLAPTGIAAVNVGGQTLHSFFKIPFKPLVPGDPDYSYKNIRQTLRYNKDKVKLIQQLELIIIDEISMVRADIIDFIDHVLRIYSGNMREPFGGKQLLFVGDVFQLEPVVTRDMRDILRRWYNQFFFFNARVFKDLGLIPIELVKIYRQTDDAFISLLDRVRVNRASMTDVNLLNSRYNPNYKDEGKFVMTLCTRRDTVDSINDEHMEALSTPEYTFTGSIEGNYPENDLPTNKELELKKGAQVIFIRNDKEQRWVNGTIAKVSEVDDSMVKVQLENGCEYELEPEMWENVQYSYDEKEKKVIENVLGSFTQFPIKPAWALTVHKSQGLTFNHVVIDFAGGAFTSGQTYVALSRCTSLEGITLLKPLQFSDIIVSPAVVNFSYQFNNQAVITQAFQLEQSARLYRKSIHAFDHGEFRTCVECFAEAMKANYVLGIPAVQRLIAKKMHRFNKMEGEINKLQGVIDAQNQMLRDLAREYVEMGDQSLGFGNLVSEDEVSYGPKDHLDEIALKSALANYNKALHIWPECVDAMIGKARLYITIDESEKAIKILKGAIAIDANCYEAHMAMAEAYGAENNMTAAIRCYKRAAKADKKAPQPHDVLACIFNNMGEEELAEKHEEMAKKLRAAAAKRAKKNKK